MENEKEEEFLSTRMAIDMKVCIFVATRWIESWLAVGFWKDDLFNGEGTYAYSNGGR